MSIYSTPVSTVLEMDYCRKCGAKMTIDIVHCGFSSLTGEKLYRIERRCPKGFAFPHVRLKSSKFTDAEVYRAEIEKKKGD